jgi:hypothetical protein
MGRPISDASEPPHAATWSRDENSAAFSRPLSAIDENRLYLKTRQVMTRRSLSR